MLSTDYTEENRPKAESLHVVDCYLCDKPLAGEASSDHIIPDHFFHSGAQHRPKLPVHQACNQGKSADDKFAVLEILSMCSLNSEAEKQLLEFLDKADSEKANANLIGKRDKVRNLRLALTMFQGSRAGLDIVHEGKTLSSFHNPPKNSERITRYMKQLCKGLYIRNMPGSSPGLPTRMIWVNYDRAKVRGELEQTMRPISNIVNNSGPARFSQVWPGRVLYYGSRVAEDMNKGYVFIEFYEREGVLALFSQQVS
jgi:hypothetical protein